MSGDFRPDRPAALSVGLLRPCILAHLIEGQSVYGYELHHWLLGIGLECDLGTVYRALNTMEAEGLLHSTWERTSGGRSRRRYELNDAGTRHGRCLRGAGGTALRRRSRISRDAKGGGSASGLADGIAAGIAVHACEDVAVNTRAPRITAQDTD